MRGRAAQALVAHANSGCSWGGLGLTGPAPQLPTAKAEEPSSRAVPSRVSAHETQSEHFRT